MAEEGEEAILGLGAVVAGPLQEKMAQLAQVEEAVVETQDPWRVEGEGAPS
jgi:hypothetical protein